ncbi:hypothetical protein D7X55_20405 [Corallococcus sp. AB049A]|uniref:Uncharacterized protein n=1 Tax=Corallococcus interemptor TaxID=2316720 RepID=A0A3A8R238_9BACT|nr:MULTISPECIES: DUF5985 family protein [Corallococcus]RKH51107.1 hypothetical protein D7Y23_11015 [Corallococcus sp. AB050B]RKH69374.1 hypothetical protein D7X96_15400 [Corallococcus interemptor]RKI63314.1 hypothetical protein D7X55_20405 [Corallococcus sp. AB049A]
MAEAVYILCALTSLACAVLLLRAWRRTRMKLLLYSGLCFSAFTVNNVLLFVDLVVIPAGDLSLARTFTSLVGGGVLLFGLIWDVS